MNNFSPFIPSYADFLHTVNYFQNLLEQYDSQTQISIIKHSYPYTVEVFHFSSYSQIHIFTFEGLLYLQTTIDNLICLPY